MHEQCESLQLISLYHRGITKVRVQRAVNAIFIYLFIYLFIFYTISDFYNLHRCYKPRTAEFYIITADIKVSELFHMMVQWGKNDSDENRTVQNFNPTHYGLKVMRFIAFRSNSLSFLFHRMWPYDLWFWYSKKIMKASKSNNNESQRLVLSA